MESKLSDLTYINSHEKYYELVAEMQRTHEGFNIVLIRHTEALRRAFGDDVAESFNSNMVLIHANELIENNLDRFHMMNDKDKPTGVFDYMIFEEIKKRYSLFVLGGVVFIYENGVFVPDDSGARLKTLIRSYIYPQFVKSNTIKRIYDLFISDHELETDFMELNNNPCHWINFKNGFYDPKEKRMIPHDPKYKSINQIPHEYDPQREVEGKELQQWLEYAIPNKDDLEMFLQYSGLELTTDVSIQKFLLLTGEGGTGKSTAIRLNESAVGSSNVSNISLTELNQRFASYGLLGKLLNSCADLEISALEDTSTLKKCLGEDTLRAEKKGADAISFKNYAKLIFSTNELPVIKGERSNGFFRRLLVLEMNKVPQVKDPELFKKLSREIDYFIHICVKALERLYENGYILESANSQRAVEQMRCDSDTVQAFLMEKCILSDGKAKTKRTILYDEYLRYCEEYSRQSLTSHNFYKSLRLKRYTECHINGSAFFVGISFRNEFETVDDNANPF